MTSSYAIAGHQARSSAPARPSPSSSIRLRSRSAAPGSRLPAPEFPGQRAQVGATRVQSRMSMSQTRLKIDEIVVEFYGKRVLLKMTAQEAV